MDTVARHDSVTLDVYVERIRYCRRAQELRWFHTQILNQNSPLYTENDLEDLLEIEHKAFDGHSEE